MGWYRRPLASRSARAFVDAAALVTAGGLASACSGADPPPTPAPICSAPQASSTDATALVAGSTAFAVALYGPVVAAAGDGQNAVFSPFSVSATIMMVGAGAAGDTAGEVQTVLHLPAPAAAEAKPYATVACQVETRGSARGDTMLVANSVWAQRGSPFLSPYLSTLADGYQAPLQQVDFAGDPSGATSDVNAWVSQHTQSRVSNLLQPGDLPAGTVLVLADAVYFKGAWSTAFDPSKTNLQPFTLSDGTQVQVETMSGSVDLGQAFPPGLAVFELGYKDGALAMDFLEPDAGNLSSFEATLTPDALASALGMLGARQHIDQFNMPKFSFDTRFNLASALAGLGLPDLFDPTKADLSGVDGKRDLFVGPVVHEALIDVDEQGTVAAAATAAGDQAFGFSSESLDRPFVFLIRDTTSGEVLFMGRVEDPRK